MKNLKTIILVVLIIILIIFISLFLRQQKTNLSSLNAVKNIFCLYPLTIGGSSMEPNFTAGSRVIFNRCIDDKGKLAEGMVVVYKNQNGIRRVGRIKKKIEDNRGVFYQIGRDRTFEVEEVSMHSIEAVYQKSN